jgi:hypothetical protein
MKAIIGCAAVCLAFYLANGEIYGEEGTRRPEISAETHGNSKNIRVGGSDSWHAVIASVRALREMPDSRDAEVIADLRKKMDDLPPAYIYEMARRTCATNQQEAMDLFNLAGMRLRYDAARCVDQTALAGVQATVFSLQSPEFKACLTDDALIPSLRRLRESQALFASRASPWWICSHGMAAIQAGLKKKEIAKSDWLKPEGDWATARAMVEDAIDYTIAKHEKK